jgi:hypothetical protein
MPQRFQFSLRALLTVTTLAAGATWLAMLGGFAVVVAFPVVVAALWGISRRDGVFLCLLVLAILLVAVLAAGMRGY